MNLKVQDLIKVCNGKLICGDANIPLKNISKDSRTITSSNVYLAIRGDNYDGNLFYDEVYKKGSKVWILDRFDEDNFDYDKYIDCTIVVVDDTIEAIQKLATYVRKQINIPVVAITGSVGKTSTKEMIASVLSEKYKVLKTIGNHNNDIGLPLTILRYQDEEVIVVEMGMNHLGEISVLSKIAQPTISVITNVGTAHIGLLGSRENILKAKMEIVDGMNDDGILVYNKDNDLLDTIKPIQNTKTFGIFIDADNMARNIKTKDNHTFYDLNGHSVEVPVMSEAFVYNSLAAFTVGEILNIEPDKIISGIKKFHPYGNRLKDEKYQNITIIDDTYNANLEAMENALEYLRDYTGKRKIAVLGDILELEEFSEEIHSEVGKLILDNKIDKVYLYGQDAKYIKEGAIASGFKEENIYYSQDKKEIAEAIYKDIQDDDVILFKASMSMFLGDIIKYIKEL